MFIDSWSDCCEDTLDIGQRLIQNRSNTDYKMVKLLQWVLENHILKDVSLTFNFLKHYHSKCCSTQSTQEPPHDLRTADTRRTSYRFELFAEMMSC
jgi:hypothetical protein